MEETITIRKSVLEKLIAEEVAKVIGEPKKVFSPQTLFSEIKFSNADVVSVNRKFDFVKEFYSDNWGYKTKRSSAPDVLVREDGCTPTANAYKVHDEIRKLTLSLFGKSMNSQLDVEEYEYAQQVYYEFKQLFLNLYETRLNVLKKATEKSVTNKK